MRDTPESDRPYILHRYSGSIPVSSQKSIRYNEPTYIRCTVAEDLNIASGSNVNTGKHELTSKGKSNYRVYVCEARKIIG